MTFPATDIFSAESKLFLSLVNRSFNLDNFLSVAIIAVLLYSVFVSYFYWLAIGIIWVHQWQTSNFKQVKFRLNEIDQLLVMTFIQTSFDPDAFEAPATSESSRKSDAALTEAGKSLRMNEIRKEM
jgi:hypothetical protein